MTELKEESMSSEALERHESQLLLEAQENHMKFYFKWDIRHTQNFFLFSLAWSDWKQWMACRLDLSERVAQCYFQACRLRKMEGVPPQKNGRRAANFLYFKLKKGDALDTILFSCHYQFLNSQWALRHQLLSIISSATGTKKMKETCLLSLILPFPSSQMRHFPGILHLAK